MNKHKLRTRIVNVWSHFRVLAFITLRNPDSESKRLRLSPCMTAAYVIRGLLSLLLLAQWLFSWTPFGHPASPAHPPFSFSSTRTTVTVAAAAAPEHQPFLWGIMATISFSLCSLGLKYQITGFKENLVSIYWYYFFCCERYIILTSLKIKMYRFSFLSHLSVCAVEFGEF